MIAYLPIPEIYNQSSELNDKILNMITLNYEIKL
jgi:hypothetical protein